MGTVTSLHAGHPGPSPLVRDALAAFADQLRSTRQRSGRYTAANTVRAYESALARLLDESRPVGDLDAEQAVVELAARFRQLWGQSSARTWNARRAALRSFSEFARERGWLTVDLAAGLEREHQPRARERARPRAEIDRLLRDKRYPARERALWRLLYATAARADEVLALNVEDLDLRNRQVPLTRKGGEHGVLTWDTEAARALSRLIGARTRGPVFLTSRRAKGAARGEIHPRDLDPDTDRGRLGYDAALKVFKAATGGWTFHDLRHSALTHAAEDGADVTVLMVKSGHRDLRQLARYARPSAERAQRRWETAHEHSRHGG